MSSPHPLLAIPCILFRKVSDLSRFPPILTLKSPKRKTVNYPPTAALVSSDPGFLPLNARKRKREREGDMDEGVGGEREGIRNEGEMDVEMREDIATPRIHTGSDLPPSTPTYSFHSSPSSSRPPRLFLLLHSPHAPVLIRRSPKTEVGKPDSNLKKQEKKSKKEEKVKKEKSTFPSPFSLSLIVFFFFQFLITPFPYLIEKKSKCLSWSNLLGWLGGA